MRTRSAKTLAQRIDLNYFKHAGGMRRWRTALSMLAPLAGLLWLGGMAAAGSRAPYSSGPVSAAHAFIEMKCETCHVRDTSFRAHVTASACLTCHDAPGHPPGLDAASLPAMPACADCHREHQGRGALALTDDTQCVDCHADSRVMPAGRFPQDHPEFAVMRGGATDPGTLKFNHAVHAKEDLRGPDGPETLECASCHKPRMARAPSRGSTVTGLMASITYETQCARCHTLEFDPRLDKAAPHAEPAAVRAFVTESLQAYIAANPAAVTERDVPARRLPLNFPADPAPQPRSAAEWVSQRAARAEQYLWTKGCADCHSVSGAAAPDRLPQIAPVKLTTRWMPKARFDHAPHLMMQCASCHTAAPSSRDTSDVLMPAVATCATCHTPAKGAASQCAACHDYHDWTKASPVKPHFMLTDFQ
ncbi:MAG TPA: hypothetical protein VMN81_06870 [Vicinamibacterales bacterium]|nr:hypothetical protein [Vicinamibacterales bacterium]